MILANQSRILLCRRSTPPPTLHTRPWRPRRSARTCARTTAPAPGAAASSGLGEGREAGAAWPPQSDRLASSGSHPAAGAERRL